ncbi:serine hydrolase domain-containing protein [Vagococcus humatus]|uniref:Beta-lactamase-related domain-containing protein n=1 Tax=Vagococcus humatus TaxID=1889241 RepID=A0A429Z8I3_9ENTE|nr:serine hydrolase domain-containing protein [Vagococcus humatus]RST89935.1 hypothetical protein C7P63_02330 [Vagococcus humatus]
MLSEIENRRYGKALTFSQLLRLTDELVQHNLVPGISLAVVGKDSRYYHYQGMMGVLPPYSHQPIRSGLLYDLASLTKIIGTTTRILQLVDTGKLKLESQVCQIIPEYPNLTMTIESLLTHSSGFPSDFQDKELFNNDYLKRYLRSFQVYKSRNTCYSDLGYIVLGLMIEEIDQLTLDESFKANIFLPLNMKDTTFYPVDATKCVPTEITKERGVIQGVSHDSKSFKFDRPLGSAGLFSTLEDVSQYADLFLKRELFSEIIYQTLQNTCQTSRTLGFEQLISFNQTPYLFHTGFTGTSLSLAMEKQESLILLSNRIHPTRDNLLFNQIRTNMYHYFC